MEWMLMPLRRYADFSGRSRRKEYWMFFLFNLLVATVLWCVIGLLMLMMYNMDASENAMMAMFMPLVGLYILYVLAVFVPSMAVTVRRFHDQDKSGWMLLLGLIPGIGGIILFVFMCLEGTRGPNRYGPDPVEDRMGPAIAA